MGTNYYLQGKNQETGRCRDLHICKTSGGWTPSMRGYSYQNDFFNVGPITSWFDWKLFLRNQTNNGGIIFNEYDEPIQYKDFVKLIEDWQKAEDRNGGKKKNHAEHALSGEFGDLFTNNTTRQYWIDLEGYSFHDGDFS